MKKLLLIVILIGCQSQADKDRAKMKKLLSTRDSIEYELAKIKYDESSQLIDLKIAMQEFSKNEDSVESYKKQILYIDSMYYVPKVDLEIKLKVAKKRIEDLKLIMSK